MEISQIIPHIEALIFASEKPLTSIELVDLVNNALGFIEDRANLEQIETAVDGIREKYASEFYPFEIRQSGGGWQFLTKGSFHKTIALLNGDKFLKRLSAAAMETLAIIAYKQPITKGEIESIRGVNCDYVIQKLLEKELVVISGRNEEMPGKPLIYNTSKSFMDYFGINTADDLPKIKEILAEQFVQPTLVNAEHFEPEAEGVFRVSETSELIAKSENSTPTTDDSSIAEAEESEAGKVIDGLPDSELPATEMATGDQADPGVEEENPSPDKTGQDEEDDEKPDAEA